MNKNSYLQRLEQGYGNRYSNINGNANMGVGPQPCPSTPGLAPLDRTIVLIAVNATDAAATAIIFGFDRQGDGTSAGSGTGITISSSGAAGPSEIKRQMQHSPFQLLSLKLRTTAVAQFDNVITYQARTYSGAVQEFEVTPTDYAEQSDNTTTIVRIPLIKGLLLDGATQFSVSINTGVTLTFIFTVGARFEAQRALQNGYVVQRNDMPAPVGAPPVELIIQ